LPISAAAPPRIVKQPSLTAGAVQFDPVGTLFMPSCEARLDQTV